RKRKDSMAIEWPAHGGRLQDLLVDGARAAALKKQSLEWPSWDLTPRQLCDVELLVGGGFSPLDGFMRRSDYESVRDRLRLSSGLLWPMPITLDVTRDVADRAIASEMLALREPEGEMVAVLHVEDRWGLDREAEAQAVYGTLDRTHPGVRYLFERTNDAV